MPTISTAKMTARQFFMLGEDPPGVRLELVDGEIAVSPSPRPSHSYTDVILAHILVDHITASDQGMLLRDVDTLFGPNDVRRPDFVYFCKDRAHLIKEDQAIDGPPDLCVEIVSPSSGVIDRKDKFEQYARGGVRYYWIVDPQFKTVEAYELVRGSYTLREQGKESQIVSLPPFPDLSIPLEKIWFRPRKK